MQRQPANQPQPPSRPLSIGLAQREETPLYRARSDLGLACSLYSLRVFGHFEARESSFPPNPLHSELVPSSCQVHSADTLQRVQGHSHLRMFPAVGELLPLHPVVGLVFPLWRVSTLPQLAPVLLIAL